MSDTPTPEECTYDPLHELMARFENVKVVQTGVDPFEGLGIEDVLQKHIVDGIKRHLDVHLEEALTKYTGLQIINDVLLAGMKTVGELFGSGKMQLPFVLQSAEVMKSAVKILEPHLDRVEGTEKGSILLATVAGDVHDIGKNLVDIILSNNGYRVVNIGIKQPINSILEKAAEHRCGVIGMSGLLVKSTLIMRENLLEMNDRGLQGIPVILGGAALTRAYVEEDLRALYKGRVFYAQDAFEGLRLMGELGEGDAGGEAEEVETPRVTSHRTDPLAANLFVFTGERSDIEPVAEPPRLPFYGARKHTKFDLFELFKYVNPVALFRGQWQFKRPDGMGNAEFATYLEENAQPIFERFQRELATVIRPQVKWGYFPAAGEGNDLVIFEEDAKTERLRFNFPRQSIDRRLCLADYFQPVGPDGFARDVAAFQVVTVGPDVTALERRLFEKGDYQDYLYVHGMGVETAEGLAEYWHRQVRHELGIADQEPTDNKLLFSAKYHGARYSFGYPACPNLEDQRFLMELLKPDEIGVSLTEEFMLNPEQSTSALIVHNPAAKYFNIR